MRSRGHPFMLQRGERSFGTFPRGARSDQRGDAVEPGHSVSRGALDCLLQARTRTRTGTHSLPRGERNGAGDDKSDGAGDPLGALGHSRRFGGNAHHAMVRWSTTIFSTCCGLGCGALQGQPELKPDIRAPVQRRYACVNSL